MDNKKYEIAPYECVGAINFLDKRDLVREKIGGVYTCGLNEFENVVELYDFFPEQDIKVLYDRNECLDSIEFFNGGIFFLGYNIMTMPYLEVKSLIMPLDTDIDINQEGFRSYRLGIGIAWDEEEDAITSVIVFKRDYYN